MADPTASVLVIVVNTAEALRAVQLTVRVGASHEAAVGSACEGAVASSGHALSEESWVIDPTFVRTVHWNLSIYSLSDPCSTHVVP